MSTARPIGWKKLPVRMSHLNLLMRMKVCFRWVLCLLCCLVAGCMVSCAPSPLEESLRLAGDNRAELEAVLDVYSRKPVDSLKLRAAEFLITHMKIHGGVRSEVLADYRKMMVQSDTVVDYHTFNPWWKQLVADKGDRLEVALDVRTVSAAYLIRNIERAFQAWEQAPWHDEVDFDRFCRYVLPYRFTNEMLADGWREYLARKYYPLIAGETDVRRAFAIIYHAFGRRSSDVAECHYTLDPIALDKQGQMWCDQYCVLMGDVCRSLGIPVAMDWVESWGNYRQQGHLWPVLVLDDGAYTVRRGDTIARKGPEVEGRTIVGRNTPEEDYPLKMAFIKRPLCVWRFSYEQQKDEPGLPESWSHPGLEDVSALYGIMDSLVVSPSMADEYLFIGTYQSRDGWTPVRHARSSEGRYVFRNLADSVVYVLMTGEGDACRPQGNPFLLVNGKQIEMRPDTVRRTTVRLTRTFPLMPHWTDQWTAMKGTYFEASNDPDFRTRTRLGSIDRTPLFPDSIRPEGKNCYRYVRYVCDLEQTRMAGLAFFCHGREVRGHLIGATPADTLLWNKDYTETYKKHSYDRVYTRGIDFGRPVELTSIHFAPKHDRTFVCPGNTYELFYYDGGWRSLGRQTADGYVLTYTNVPLRSLLLLRNVSARGDERIFTYEQGRQVWW